MRKRKVRGTGRFFYAKCSGAGAGQGLPGPWPDLFLRRGALRNARDRRHAGICVATIPGWAAEQDTPFRENHPANGKEGKKFSGPAPRSLSAGGLVCYNRGDMTERVPRRGRSRLCRPFRGASEAVPGRREVSCFASFGQRESGAANPFRPERKGNGRSGAKAGQNESEKEFGFSLK